jgi:hypothetical protein
MKKLVFSLILGSALFISSFAVTSLASKRFLPADDCPMCEASIMNEGKRCILNGCSGSPGDPVTICSYNCGSLQPPQND